MKMKRSVLMVGAVLAVWCGLGLAVDVRKEISFPDVPGYVTLKCDFHSHTVFSDGRVWPTVRIDEAWRCGLDATAITDHIEYLKFKEDIPPNLDRPYEIIDYSIVEHDILVPRGAEITRDTPPGHFNAIFLDSVKPLDTPEFVDSIEAANKQGAFVFWNHQGWQGEEKGKWLDVHTEIYEKKWLHGMEVANDDDYYPTAHKWCVEKGLTMLGNSDIHQPDLRKESLPDDHRPLTLVLAKERTLAGIKEALFAGRTIVWFQKMLIGREEYLRPMFEACVKIYPVHYKNGTKRFFKVHNMAAVEMHLKGIGKQEPGYIYIPPESTVLVKARVDNKKDEEVVLKYEVTNFLVAPGEGLPVEIKSK